MRSRRGSSSRKLCLRNTECGRSSGASESTTAGTGSCPRGSSRARPEIATRSSRSAVGTFRQRIQASDGVSKLPTSCQSFRWPVGTFRRRIQASDRLSEGSDGLLETLTGYQSLRQAVGSLDTPLEGSDELSESRMSHWKLG